MRTNAVVRNAQTSSHFKRTDNSFILHSWTVECKFPEEKMLMIMETARRINLSHKPLSCDMSVSVAHDICTALAVVLFYFSEHGHPV